MNLNDYQEKAARTAIYPGRGSVIGISYTALGLNGEAGEVAEKVKKILRDIPQSVNDDYAIDENTKAPIVKELGDSIWYIALAAREIGVSLEQVAQINLDKLASRHSRDKISGSGDNR